MRLENGTLDPQTIKNTHGADIQERPVSKIHTGSHAHTVFMSLSSMQTGSDGPYTDAYMHTYNYFHNLREAAQSCYVLMFVKYTPVILFSITSHFRVINEMRLNEVNWEQRLKPSY